MLSMESLSFPAAVPLRSCIRSSFFRGDNTVLKRRAQVAAPRCAAVKTEALFGGGGRATAARTAYICKDCGYIYDGRESFEDLDKSYRCPVCSAPKRRFTVYNQPVPKGANNLSTRKERKAELQASSSGGLNPGIVLAVGAAVVLGAFLYLNSVY